MKQIFLTITLFSILAILPFALFAQSSENLNALADRMVQEFKEDKFDEGIETANKLLKRDLTPESKKFIFTKRSVFLFTEFIDTDIMLFNNNARRYSQNTIEKLRIAGSDYGELINHNQKISARTKNDEKDLSYYYGSAAEIYFKLGRYGSHQPADFAKAESYYRLSLAKSEYGTSEKVGIVASLAGQYKFAEALELARQMLVMVVLQEDLVKLMDAFDSMGEYNIADALLLEKSDMFKSLDSMKLKLGDTSELANLYRLKESRLSTVKLYSGVANPQSAMELNRQGGWLIITRQCDKAIPLLEKSLKVSETPTANRLLMGCYAEKQNIAGITEKVNLLLSRDSNDVMALTYRGVLNAMKNDVAKAEADISKAIEIFPELAAMHNALNTAKQIYHSQGKTQKLNEILALEKRIAEAHAANAAAKP